MRISRCLFALLVFCLLFAQQAGAAHALRHVLDDAARQQQDQQAPHSDACEKCAAYTNLGSALKASALAFLPLAAADAAAPCRAIAFRSALILHAAARGPPPSPRTA